MRDCSVSRNHLPGRKQGEEDVFGSGGRVQNDEGDQTKIVVWTTVRMIRHGMDY